MIYPYLTVAILSVTIFFQVRNFIKYRKTNGANMMRIKMLLTSMLFMIHSIRLILDITIGLFFLLGVLTFLWVYNPIDWEWIKSKLPWRKKH